jgi:hypothetical protein
MLEIVVEESMRLMMKLQHNQNQGQHDHAHDERIYHD